MGYFAVFQVPVISLVATWKMKGSVNLEYTASWGDLRSHINFLWVGVSGGLEGFRGLVMLLIFYFLFV